MTNKKYDKAENLTHPLLTKFLDRIISFGEIPDYLYWYNATYDFTESNSYCFYFYNKERNHYIYVVADNSLINRALKIYKDIKELYNNI